MLRAMCNKAALMHEGHMINFGSVQEILDQYYSIVHGVFKPVLPASG
jgi:ABC-type polysaccharide/polyol phosphate transport system ATPase subunit